MTIITTCVCECVYKKMHTQTVPCFLRINGKGKTFGEKRQKKRNFPFLSFSFCFCILRHFTSVCTHWGIMSTVYCTCFLSYFLHLLVVTLNKNVLKNICNFFFGTQNMRTTLIHIHTLSLYI